MEIQRLIQQHLQELMSDRLQVRLACWAEARQDYTTQ